VRAPHRRPGAVGHGIDGASGRVGDPGAVPVPVRALDASAEEPADLAAAARDAPVEVHPFSGDFTAWLEPAALSISRCGYNTSTALLRSRVPATRRALEELVSR
jgi:hypothetical protein